MTVRQDPTLTADDFTRLVDRYLAVVRAQDRATPNLRSSPDAATSRRAQIRLHDDLAASLLDREFSGGGCLSASVVRGLAEQIGIAITPDSPDEAAANAFLTRALAHHHAECAAILRADDRVGTRSIVDRMLAALGLTPPLPVLDPAAYGIADTRIADEPSSATIAPTALAVAPTAPVAVLAPPATPDMPATALVAAVWTRFVEYKVDKSHEWKASRRTELKSSLAVWQWLGAPTDLGAVDNRTGAHLRERFLGLPADYDEIRSHLAAKRRISRAAVTPDAVLAEAQRRAKTFARVKAKTWNKHAGNYQAFFTWAASVGEFAGESNPFGKLHVRVKKRGAYGRAERDDYSLEEIAAIFATPVWHGRKSVRFKSQPGTVIVKDALYWIPLIAAFHGLRREEAAQLRVRHVRREHDIWFFDLEADDLVIKGEEGDSAGIRRVPLHKDFLALGFLEDKVLRRKPGDLLFTELRNDNAHGAYGDQFGKNFTYYLRSCRLFPDAPELGIHRFRHTFITVLGNTSAKESYIEALTGHASGAHESERKRYEKRVSLENLKATIDLLDLPIRIPIAAGRS